MGPYTKTSSDGDWIILDGDDEAIASAQTETLADYIMAALLGQYPLPPDFPVDVAIPSEDDGDDPD